MKGLDFKNIYEWPIMTRVLAIGLLCAGIFYMSYRWDITPLHSQLTLNENTERDLKQQLEIILNQQTAVVQETALLPNLEILLKQWQKKMIPYSYLPELLNEILKIGGNNHLYFSLFNPGDEIKEGVYDKVPIKIIAVGSYHQFSDFVSQIANMPWIVVISDFTISKDNRNDVLGSKLAQQAAAQNLLTNEMTLEVYYLPVKPNEPANKNLPENKKT